MPMDTILVTGLIFASIVLLILISILYRDRSEMGKVLLFGAIVLVAFSYTVYLSTTTVLKNLDSATKGPVHWHADFQIWQCGREIKLKSPSGLSNRIGTPLLHEHGDKRIHVEGAPEGLGAVSLGSFFKVIGGEMGNNFALVPTDNGLVRLESGQQCNGEALFQVFIYSLKGQLIEQKKIDNPQNFILQNQTLVPPGNCIIIEQDTEKLRTEHLCESYKAAKDKGEIYGR
jgi:hypothetical protein